MWSVFFINLLTDNCLCVIYTVITVKQTNMSERRVILKISQTNGIPIYQQIADYFRVEILAGHYKQGEFLPSIRELARDLKISVITTMKAYEQLQAEGLVTAMQGRGFFVNAQDSEMLREQHLRKVEDALADAIRCAKIAGMSNDELITMLQALLEI